MPGRRPISRSLKNADPCFGKSRIVAEAPTASSESLCISDIKRPTRRLNASANQFDDDMLRGAIAQGDAGAAYLTEKCSFTGNFLNDRGLAKPDFSQSLAGLGLSCQFAHAAGGADGKFGKAHALGLLAWRDDGHFEEARVR